MATYDCVLVHVRVRIRVHLCDGGERERIAPVARVTDAMHPCDPSLSRPRASHFPFRPIALATMIRVRVVFAGGQPEALGHLSKKLRALQLLEATPAASSCQLWLKKECRKAGSWLSRSITSTLQYVRGRFAREAKTSQLSKATFKA